MTWTLVSGIATGLVMALALVAAVALVWKSWDAWEEDRRLKVRLSKKDLP